MLEKRKVEEKYSQERVIEIIEMVLKYLLAMVAVASIAYCTAKTNTSNPIYLTGKLEVVQPQGK